MSRLFKLKEWVTLQDAAKYLSLTLDEEVSQVDLLRLVLDKHLTLSVLFANGAPARKGKKIPTSEVLFKEIPSIIDGDLPILMVMVAGLTARTLKLIRGRFVLNHYKRGVKERGSIWLIYVLSTFGGYALHQKELFRSTFVTLSTTDP